MPLNKIKEDRFVGVFRESEELIESTISACYDGGMKVFELTQSTPNVCKYIEKTATKYSDSVVGVGTVLNKQQAEDAIKAGASFVVSPIFCQGAYEVCKEKNVLYIPGFMTFQEMFDAREKGLNALKLFPAGTLGFSYLKTLKSLFKDVEIMTTGGVSKDNANEWLASGACSVGIGSEISKLAKEKDFKALASMISEIKASLV